MKALISPIEVFTYKWVSSWELIDEEWQPVYSEVDNCLRVAEVELENNVFEVSSPLYWFDCPDECKADQWYYKDGQVYIKQQNVPIPE